MPGKYQMRKTLPYMIFPKEHLVLGLMMYCRHGANLAEARNHVPLAMP